MAASRFREYVRRAFHARVPVKGLGPISLNKWALVGAAILGLGAPPLWLLALGLEVLYLYWLSTNPRFRALVDGERLEGERARWTGRVNELEARLGRKDLERFRRLAERCREIQRLSHLMGGAVESLEEAKASGLEQLLYMHLKLLVSRATLETHLPAEEQVGLEKEIEKLEKELARPDLPEAVRRSRSGTLEIEKRRLMNLKRSAEERAFLESELERIEKQVELLRQDTALERDAAALSSRIDTVVGSLGETSEWMRRNADLLGDLGDEKPREVPLFLERKAMKEGS